jgi:hypothetical protein
VGLDDGGGEEAIEGVGETGEDYVVIREAGVDATWISRKGGGSWWQNEIVMSKPSRDNIIEHASVGLMIALLDPYAVIKTVSIFSGLASPDPSFQLA